jgi:ABC-type phosphate/phosphonate transport system substrate-binding protein
MKSTRINITFMTLVSAVWILSISNFVAEHSYQKEITFGFYSSIIEERNANELIDSFKIWGQAIQKQSKVEWFSKAKINYHVYLNRKEFFDAIKNSRVEFINLSSLDFYEMKLQNLVTPLLAANKMPGTKFAKYLLVAHSSSSINSISDIKKGEIIIPNSYSLNLMKTWINVELKEKQGKGLRNSISIISSEEKENEALYGVFFKKIEYCVMHEATLLIASELNPQLKKSIKVIAYSPNLINNFLANLTDADPASVEILLKEGIQLQKHVWGKQLLNLMQSESMHKINLEDMNETTEMINKYNLFFK